MTELQRKLVEKNGTLREEYETLVIRKIRQRYSLSQELAIQRKRTTKPEEFERYNDYVEWCVKTTKAEFTELGYNIEEMNENE
jgi:hypothetical protein